MIMDLKLVHNAPLIAAAALDSKITLWDLNTNQLQQTLNGHSKVLNE